MRKYTKWIKVFLSIELKLCWQEALGLPIFFAEDKHLNEYISNAIVKEQIN